MTDDLPSPTTKENTKKLVEVAENCEKLLKETEEEINIYSVENINLKEEIVRILRENKIVEQEIENLRKTVTHNNEETEKHEKLTKNAIDILKSQIKCLKEERDTINALWQTSKETITNLESEVTNYREQIFKPNAINDIKLRYSSTITLLENTIKSLRKELNRQIKLNNDILSSKSLAENRLKSSEIKTDELKRKLIASEKKEIIISNLKQKLDNMMQKNADLEKFISSLKKIIDERIYREKSALEKIQEALQIADLAINEKDEALKRETVIREECDNLATTIGQVMEEAANKVEKDVEKLKLKHADEITKIKTETLETMKHLEQQQKNTNSAEVRAQALEKKLKEVVQENVALDADLHVASQAIVELELKLEAIESLMNTNKKTLQFSEEREKEIKKYLHNNQELKKRWKAAIEDVTEKFEKEINILNHENGILKTENQELKLKLLQYE